MSFELILTSTFIPGIDRRLENESQALRIEDFELLMDGAPLRRRLDDGTCWLWHPKGMPWVAAKFHAESSSETYIALSVSHSHKDFLRVWADAFELALRLAKSIGCRVFEDASYNEITNDNLEALLAPESDFVLAQLAVWKETVENLNARMLAPLEYPVGSHDAVSDYFTLFLEPEKKVTVSELASESGFAIAPDSLGKDCFATCDEENQNLLGRVILREEDQVFQIWPFYWMESFSLVARHTFALAKKLQRMTGGDLYFGDQILKSDLESQILKLLEEEVLGIEFFFWWNQYRKTLVNS